MRIAIGSDEQSHLTEFVVAELARRGHAPVLFGALSDEPTERDWPVVSSRVATAVANGFADEGIVFCWTGTGASIAANKVRGIRAALVHDAETARGARIWNHANVLVFSLRATSEAIAKEILDAWFSTPITSGEAQTEWNLLQIQRVSALEEQFANEPK